MESATARLRKPFQYPGDDDSDDSLPEALDEEEQESLIRTLSTRNTTTNTLYTHLFLACPLLSALIYLPSLFSPSRSSTLLALLSLTSLLSTAYLLYTLPPGETGLAFLDTSTKVSQAEHPPLRRYLPYLNLVLSGLLFLRLLVAQNEEITLALLPGTVYGFVLVVKKVMGSVDVGELVNLKYGYKGA